MVSAIERRFMGRVYGKLSPESEALADNVKDCHLSTLEVHLSSHYLG